VLYISHNLRRRAALFAFAMTQACVVDQERPRFEWDAGSSDGAPTRCTATIRGQVRFPSGSLAAPGVLVYVAPDPDSVARSGECGECVDTSLLIAHSITTQDGSFELTGVPVGTHELLIEHGLFQRRVSIEVPTCETQTLPAARTALPGTHSDGRIPRILVSRGSFDAMESVLTAVGITDFDVVDALQASDLDDHDFVFLDCGQYAESTLLTPTMEAALRGFVERGGRLYATDQAYDAVEQAFPTAIAFEGDVGATAGNPDAAQIGYESSATGTIHDEQLSSWLSAHDALDASGTIPISHLLGGWAEMSSAAANTKVWVTAHVGGSERPMTASFGSGCGTVLYTSYHTTGGSSALDAQELILAFLAFQIAECAENPVVLE
jgi:hypothetical protein